MKVIVVGYRKNHFENEIKKEKELELTEYQPDIVIAFGGEGTFLYSEMIYPGIPKVLVRHPSKCKKCSKHDYKKVIKALVNNQFQVVEFVKIVGSVRGKKVVGLNDINIHYKPPCAIRLNVDVGKKTIAKEVISDGVIISTPYGASGYYSSITRKTFDKGLGIAFNNPVTPVKPRVVPEGSVIKVKITRGPGILCADCNQDVISLKTGDVVKIQKHSQYAIILKLKGKTKVRI